MKLAKEVPVPKKLSEHTEQELLMELVKEQKRTNKMLNLGYTLTVISLVILGIYVVGQIISSATGQSWT